MRFVQAGVLVLGVPMYVLFFVFFGDSEVTGNLEWLPFVIVGGWNLLVLIAAVISIVDAALKVRARKSRQLGTTAMVTKLAGLPFFALSVFVMVGLLWLSFGILLFGGPVLWVIVPIMAVVTYFILLSTSVYGWAAAVQLRREHRIDIALTVIYVILLLLPLGDLVAGVLLFGHSRRRPRLALTVLLLSIGLLSIAVGVCGIVGLFDFFSLTTVSGDGDRTVPIVVLLVGVAVVLVTGIVAFILRPTLRAEARKAAIANSGLT